MGYSGGSPDGGGRGGPHRRGGAGGIAGKASNAVVREYEDVDAPKAKAVEVAYGDDALLGAPPPKKKKKKGTPKKAAAGKASKGSATADKDEGKDAGMAGNGLKEDDETEA
jgi:hypothetical protein